MKTLVICIAIISTVLINSTFSQKFDRSQKPSTLNKADRFSHYSKFNINNISTFIYNNGNADLMPTGNSGFEFPKGSNKYAVFESGLLWGGIINNKIHVGGSTYSQGLLGGKILEDGTPQNPEDESARVYRVRPDFLNSDLYAEINGSEGTISEIRKQYETDWNEWPANDGAPFNDLDNDGIYNPQIDIPGVPGADQTLWYVANDFDDETVFNMYGSEPMKLEVQVTVWGYKHYDIYDNVLFKKYKVINKNSENIDSMYFTIWSDPDLGDAGDDLVGCDTLLNLGYSYNGDDDDAVYRSEIPAVGFQILQGPIVNGTSDEFAIKDNQKVYGKKNVGMTSFFFFIGGDDVYNDPDLGDYQYGTLGFYNIMRGRIPHTGSPFIDPRTNETTMFVLSGDPITKEGWIDGVQYWPGDRRMAMTSGPFELKADSTQEIIFAELAAVDKDRLSSVVLLKDFAKDFQNNFPLEVEEPETPNINNLIPELVYKNLGVYNQIELEIVGSKEITNFSEMGYKFQGYNIYQLPGDYDYSKNSIKIKTFDIIDDVTQIMGEVLDPATGEITYGIYQNGTDSGIPKKVSIEKDYFDNSPLLKGKKYFYGISAYFNNINPKAEIKAIESRLSFVTATFQDGLEGPNFLDTINTTHKNGNADAGVLTEVINPYELTGDTYEVRFGRQNYFLDFDGNWKPKENTNLNKNSLYKDISPSTLTGKAVTTTTSGIIALQFRLNLISPQEASADGIKLTLPSNIQISSIEETLSKFNGRAIPYTQTGNEIFWGNNDTTQRGFYTFRGSEILTINVNSFTPPLNYSYIIYDDGFGNYPPEPINAEGNATITEIEFAEKTEKFWNLFNKTKNSNALEHQTIISGIDVNTNDEAPFGDEPIIDGFRIKIKGTFDPPKTISEVIINGKNITQPWSNGIFQDGYFKISDFNYFSNYINGTSFIKNGYGTNDINKLMQDYEFRFTGESDLIKVNNTKVYITKEGTGSFATFYGAQQYDITQHPLNDEKAERFLVRVPFEVWNKDLGIQVNYQFYDRDQYYDSLYSDFYTWNSFGRMYGEILNTPYTAELITEEMTQTMSDDFTWNNIWNTSAYNTGDIVEINYLNSIQQGDVFTFTTPNSPADKISPSEYNLFQNYPNPFNPNTKIRFTVPEEGLVKLTVYNILGQKIKELVNQNYKAGKYEAEFAGYQYASGVYIYRIEMNNFVKTKKMMLLK